MKLFWNEFSDVPVIQWNKKLFLCEYLQWYCCHASVLITVITHNTSCGWLFSFQWSWGHYATWRKCPTLVCQYSWTGQNRRDMIPNGSMSSMSCSVKVRGRTNQRWVTLWHMVTFVVSDSVTCGDVCCEGRPCAGVTFTCTLSRFAGDFWQTMLVTSGFSLRSMSHNENYWKVTLRVIISVVVNQSIGQHALIVQSVSCEIVTHP